MSLIKVASAARGIDRRCVAGREVAADDPLRAVAPAAGHYDGHTMTRRCYFVRIYIRRTTSFSSPGAAAGIPLEDLRMWFRGII